MKLHSTLPNSLHFIQSPPLLFPTQSSVCPASCLPLKHQKPQIPHHPLMVQVKIKDGYFVGFVLAAGSSHSFIRSPFRSCLTTQLPASFVHRPSSAPHVCVFRASHPHLFPPTAALLQFIFTCGVFAPKPHRFAIIVAKMCLLLNRQGFKPPHPLMIIRAISFLRWYENNCHHTFQCKLFPIPPPIAPACY